MAKIGLVTVLYNSDEVLDGFLKSLSIQKFTNFHLYLVDNLPSESSRLILDKLLNKYSIVDYTYILNQTNVGVAKGNNQGIEASRKDGSVYTILLNNDLEFDDPNLIGEIFLRAENDGENLVIPKIFYFDSKKIWMAGGSFNLNRGTIIHRGENREDGLEFSSEYHCQYAPTCFMLIRNSVFDKIGIMDEKYFVYYDDTDFLYRAYIAGYKIKFLPNLHILHKVSSSTGGSESAFTIYYANRNRIYFIRKNFQTFRYIVAISFTLVTRIFKYISYRNSFRNKLKQALVDGFKL